MAVGNLMNADSPYVHSNIYHIMGSVRDFFSNSSEQLAQKEIEKTIKIFESWIDQLQAYEQEIYNFCGVSDFQSLNAKLFGSEQEDKIVAAARAVILESDTMLRLIPSITEKQANAIFKVLKGTSIETYLPNIEQDLTLNETRAAVVAALQDMFSGSGDKIVKAEALAQLGGSQKFKKAIDKDLSDWLGRATVRAKSKGSKIHQLADAILKEKVGEFIIPYNKFQDIFIEKFKNRVTREQLAIPANKSLEQLAEDTCKRLYSYLFDGRTLTDIANILGERGEGLLGFTLDNTSLNIEVLPTGKQSEKQIAEYFKKELGIAASKIKMKDYTLDGSGGSAQSKSDMIIKIIGSNGTRLFRVQSKDSLMGRLEKANYGDSVYQTIRMLENNVSSILHMLSEKTIIDQGSIDTLSYYIANMTWFYENGSYDNESVSKRTRTEGSGGGIGGMQEAINRIISQGIQAFVGVTIEDELEENPLPINMFASNVFYFLSARTLFPVSEVLKAAIDQMRGFSQLLFSTRFVINTGSASFNPKGAKEFWEEKLRAVGTEGFQGLIYTNGGLVNVGTAQGATIINTVTGRINFTFDIGKILMLSSYVF